MPDESIDQGSVAKSVPQAKVVQVNVILLHFELRIVDRVTDLCEVDLEAGIVQSCLGNEGAICTFAQDIKTAGCITIDIRENGSQEAVEITELKIIKLHIDPVL